MLTLEQLRKDTNFAKERLAHKHFKDIHFIDEVISLDDKRKLIKSYLDDFLAQRNAISKEIIQAVRKMISIPLIVGGGLRSAEQITTAFKAGADIVVIGTAIEKDILFLEEIKNIQK